MSRKNKIVAALSIGALVVGLFISESTNRSLLRTNTRLLELNAQLILRETQVEATDARLKRSCDGLKAAADVLYDSNLRMRTALAQELGKRAPKDLGCATDKGCR